MPQPSNAESWRRVRDILHRALELPLENRDAYVVEACGNDDALRAEVESLLAASGGATFLDEPGFALTTDQGASYGRFQPGKVISHYRIVEKIGEGGMGEVYKAVDTLLGRTVALKVIADPDGNRRRRFEREAKAASALNHPNIVTIYEFNTENDVDFIAMEYVEGVTLGQLLHQPLEKLLGYARQAASAVACAHAAGIVHRDLKPNNIMATPDGLVKVLDFGLAKLQGPTVELETTRSVNLTHDGDLVGTPAYISPEQILGHEVGPTADVFCFGIILYEIACGRRPFEGETAFATLDQVAHKELPAPASLNPAVGSELSAIIRKCLNKAPAERPQSMAEVAAVLESLPSRNRKPSLMNRRRWIVAAAGVTAATLYLGRGILWSPLPPTLTYSIEAQRPGEDKPYIASPSDTFDAFSRIRLHLQPPSSGFLYVVNQGPGQGGAEEWWVLYSGPVASGREVVTGWNAFDQNPGTERLWLIWTDTEIAELAQLGKVEKPDAAARIGGMLAALSRKKSTVSGKADTLATLLELRHR